MTGVVFGLNRVDVTIATTIRPWTSFLAPCTSCHPIRVDNLGLELFTALPLNALVELSTNVSTGVTHNPISAHSRRELLVT